MKIAGEHTFDAPQETVWEVLQDPTALAAVLPGCEKLERTGDDEYEGALNIKVGPVQGRFQGKIKLSDIAPPSGYTMSVDGRGAPGFVRATARVGLAADGDRTVLSYDSDAQVGGRIASVGQRLLDSSARAVIGQSLEGLAALLQARTATVAAPAAATTPDEPGEAGAAAVTPPVAAAYQPPSQAEFAARVAKEVARDLVPRPALVAIGVLVLLLIVYFLLRS